MNTTRRKLFQYAAAAATGLSGIHGAPAETAASRERLQEFSYGDVKLTGGPLKSQYDRIHAHFLGLDNDRLLKVYRQRAGLAAPGDDMGGWYDANGFVPGHTLGQYISGLSRFYSSTGDGASQAKVKALVEGYAATLGSNDYPYASEKAAITWPCYVLDKYEAGLLDSYRLAGVPMSKDLLKRVIRGAIPFIPDHTYDRGPNSPKQAPYDETYILSENLFNSYEITGETQFFEMAKMYLLNAEYYDPLAQGKNVLPGKHAYSHVISLSSAGKAYQVLGERRYLDAIKNAWDMIEQTQQFAAGGWGPNEAFVPPHEGRLGDSLTTTRNHFETPCGAFAHLKLARYLLRFTGEARYGDGLERVLYNAMLASRDPGADGQYFYYSDYQSNAKKGFYKSKWPCCSGTLAQAVADYPLNIYFKSPQALYVNVYTPSLVMWNVQGVPVKLTQSTQYPRDDTVELRIETPHPVNFSLNLRIPFWLQSPARLTVNGKSANVKAEKRTFASVQRRWKNNDTVELRLPFSTRTEPVDDRHGNIAAIMHGPLMLVATNGPATIPALSPPPELKPLNGNPPTFALNEGESQLQLRPFHSVVDETYSTYFKIRA